MRKVLALVCAVAVLVGLVPAAQLQGAALAADGAYQVGYARVDIDPYVTEDDPDSGIMALPLRGSGDVWNRLSIDGKLDDDGDGDIDGEDGLAATCIAVSDEDGRTVLLITVDLIGGAMEDKVRSAVAARVNGAIADGTVTGVLEISKGDVYYAGTHTHNAPDTTVYTAAGKTGTNNDGVDLSAVNEDLGTWIDRTIVDIGDAAIMALQDRAEARLVKDQIAVSDAVSPVVQGKVMLSTRHYLTEVDGVSFYSGDNFNAVDKYDYADTSDYRTSRGVAPQQVTQADDTMYFLKFRFDDSSKLPVILTSWRGHPSLNCSDSYDNSSRNAITSDYVNAFRRALEYGCDVTFDGATGYVTGWTLGTTRKYRVALFQGSGGSIDPRGYEQVTYSGTEGDKQQYAYSWIDGSAKTAQIKGRGCSYGVVLAALAQEGITDGLNETAVEAGKIRSLSKIYYAKRKATGVTRLGYDAALAYQAAVAEGTVSFPYKYTDPQSGEAFLIGSRFHASTLISAWDKTLDAPRTTPIKVEVSAFVLGQDVAFVVLPGEPFDFYYKDTTLTGEAKYAEENDLWNDLVDEATYGRPFVLGYCNGVKGYFPNYEAYTYEPESEDWVVGSYETHTSSFEQGTGEALIRLLDQMLAALAEGGDMTYTGPCAHCGEDQLWQPYDGQTSLTTGHYYLCSQVYTNQIKIAGGQTVCIDLNGYTLSGETRAIYTADTVCDTLNIMDLSPEQTGVIQGCGASCGAGKGFGGGTILVSEGDVMNLYSGTLTSYDRTGHSVAAGGVLRIRGSFYMYGGKVTGGTASAFTGSYPSGSTVKTATTTGSGGCVSLSGGFYMFGGEVSGGKLTSITGTVTGDATDGYVYSQEAQELDGNGPCVWVDGSGTVTLGQEAAIDHIQFSDADALTVTGRYTGTVELGFDTVKELTELTVVGEAPEGADVSYAGITFTDAEGMTAAVKGTELVVSDSPYSYGTCDACGECRWTPLEDADFDGFGKFDMDPGHYRLWEDVATAQKQLNGDGTRPGTFCVDLAGHTLTGDSRAFYVGSDAVLNLMDHTGGGVLEGKSGAAFGGGVLYAYDGGCISLYSGTVRHNTANSETILAGGVVRANGGSFHMYGGLVEGGNVSTYGGAVYVTTKGSFGGTFTASGGRITTGTAEQAGPCVYAGAGCQVVLSGTAVIDRMTFAGSSAELLTVEGTYTGAVALEYPASVQLTDRTDVGNAAPEASVAQADIRFVDAQGKTAAVLGTELVVSEQPHTYVPETLYLLGSFNDQAAVQPMTRADNIYSATLTLDPGSYSFRIGDAEGFCRWPAEDRALTLDYGSQVYVELDVLTGTVTVGCTTLYADVTFEDHDGTVLSAQRVPIGAMPEVPSDPVRQGDCEHRYSFAGWSLAVTVCTGDAVYTAVYDEAQIDGHTRTTVDGKPATCVDSGLTDGAVCSVCGQVLEEQQVIPATQHLYQGVVTEAGCTTQGYTTYTCLYCGDVIVAEQKPAIGHSYENGSCTVCGGEDPDYVAAPGLTLSYPTLSFEDEIFYNVYYTVGDTTDVEEMGLMLLPSLMQDGTIEDATALIPGYVTNGVAYMARSEGVAAAYMGDTVYFKVYAKMTDGTYAYSNAGGYNAKAYANTVLGGDYTSEMKSLVVAMVNYGAEAQLYFGHNTDKLVNSALTDEQKVLVDIYDEAMVDNIVSADSSKTANFVRVSSNFSSLYPSVSFDSAFSINFYCTPTITVDDGMTLYYWDAEDYASIDEFTVDNATGSMEMTLSATGQYWGQVPGIAAKDMDKTYYVSCVFESEGETVTTGIISYSLGKYCEGKAATDGDAQQTFAQATAVYGYYAKQYFASIA